MVRVISCLKKYIVKLTVVREIDQAGSARANYERKMQQTFSADMKRADFEAHVKLLSAATFALVKRLLIILIDVNQLARDKVIAGAATSDERVVMKRRAREAAEQAYERDIEMRVKVIIVS